MKNIPTASRSYYLKKLCEKTEQFLKRLRWKAIFYKTPGHNLDSSDGKDTYGFKSRNSPPVVEGNFCNYVHVCSCH